jgi:hypothetical protein
MPSEVKRYNGMTGYIVESVDGECVMYGDYDTLRTELERVTQQRDELVKALELIATRKWGHDHETLIMNFAEFARYTLNRIKEQA